MFFLYLLFVVLVCACFCLLARTAVFFSATFARMTQYQGRSVRYENNQSLEHITPTSARAGSTGPCGVAGRCVSNGGVDRRFRSW